MPPPRTKLVLRPARVQAPKAGRPPPPARPARPASPPNAPAPVTPDGGRPAPPTTRLTLPLPPGPDPTALEPLAADMRFARLTAEQLVSEVHAQRRRITTGFYAMGLLLRELSRPERYRRELGYPTFDDLLERRYLTNRMTALRYIAVASVFDEPIAQDLGMEKSYALLKYASVRGQASDAPRLYVANALIGDERVREISSREIVRATRALRDAAAPASPTEEEASARRAARALQAALRRSGAKGAVARAKRHEGAWSVSVHVAPDEALQLAGAM